MPQSLVQIYVHVIFSTKHRKAYLADRMTRERLHAYISGICTNHDCPAIQIGGVEDHIHISMRLSKTLDISTVIREIKRDSTKWMRETFPTQIGFHWQSGYGAFSISATHVDPLTKYIRNQEEHHREESFQDEFRRICKIYNAGLDERYVWDED